jgi:hypothetical protein
MAITSSFLAVYRTLHRKASYNSNKRRPWAYALWTLIAMMCIIYSHKKYAIEHNRLITTNPYLTIDPS